MNLLIKTKLNEITASTTPSNESQVSYAAILGQNGNGETTTKDFRAIMLATKNEEMVEEADRKRRVKNLIIHNKNELTPEHDKAYTQHLVKELKVGDIDVKQIERLGQKDNAKKRPIKIVFNNEEDKEKVLNNLKNLKDIQIYKGISITPDHT